MITVDDVVAVPGVSGYWSDDQAALRLTSDHSFASSAAPVTPGFRTVRQPGETVSVLLLLSDGQVAHGDCAAVQYPGVGGRERVFVARDGARIVEETIRPVLRGRPVDSFRSMIAPLHLGEFPAALAYGVSQAVLDASARVARMTIAEVVRAEYDTRAPLDPVPVFAQSGDDRYGNVEKMIAKRVAVLPHGLINNVEEKFGRQGEIFRDYVRWVADRASRVNDPDYRPVLHFDVYGTPGLAFGLDVDAIAGYLAEIEVAARPFRVRIEHPVDAGSRGAQLATMAALRKQLLSIGSSVELVVDEWCNKLEDIELFVAARAAHMIHVKMPDLGSIDNSIHALLRVKQAGLGAYAGGSCNETDRSAAVSAQVAMACAADQVLAKPGMGVDEGLMIVGNEMARTAALARRRTERGRDHASSMIVDGVGMTGD